MALNGYLRLKIDGSDVDTAYQEDFTVNNMGGTDVSNTIEVLHFHAAVSVGTERSHGVRATGHRRHEPAQFTCRLGKSTALLAQALKENSRIDLSMEIYAANGDTGDTELQYKYEIDQGRLVSFSIENPNTLDHETSTSPTLVRFSCVPHTVRWISETQGNEAEDRWDDHV